MARALEWKQHRQEAGHDSALCLLALRYSARLHYWFVFEHSERRHPGRSNQVFRFHERTAVSVAGRGIESGGRCQQRELSEASRAADGALSTVFWRGQLRRPRRSIERAGSKPVQRALSVGHLAKGIYR